VYVDTRPSDDAVLRANSPGPKGCFVQAAMRQRAAWSGHHPDPRHALSPGGL